MAEVEHLVLVVPGEPQVWQRAGKKGKRHFTRPTHAAQRDRVQAEWLRAGRPTVDGPDGLTLSARFYLARPDGHFGTGRNAGRLKPSAPTRPKGNSKDLDNLVKLVLDALNGLAFVDDHHVVSFAGVHALYADDGEPRTEILLRPATPVTRLDPLAASA